MKLRTIALATAFALSSTFALAQQIRPQAPKRSALHAHRSNGLKLKWIDRNGYLAIRLLDGEINFL
jgi:hypothetical protein